MIDFADIGLRAIGLFYAFAGVVATRAVAQTAVIDRALRAVSMEPLDGRESGRLVWLFAASIIIFFGGVAAFIQHEASVGLFLTSATLQALYLTIAAPFFFDAVDGPDVTGRQRTINAFVIYLLATAFVLWAGANEKLRTAAQIPDMMQTIATLAVIVFGIYVLRLLWLIIVPAQKPRSTADDPGQDPPSP